MNIHKEILDFLRELHTGFDCDTGANGSHPYYCRCCQAESLLKKYGNDRNHNMELQDNVEKIKEVRKETGDGLFNCKKALEKCNWDVQSAIAAIREQERQEHDPTYVLAENRPCGVGIIATHTHLNKIGAMVEIGTQSDFCARTEEVKEFAHQLCVHVCAYAPNCIWIEEYAGEPRNAVALFEQPWIYDESRTVLDMLKELNLKTGESVGVKRISRFSL